MTQEITTQAQSNAVAAVIQHNDLSKLSTQQRNDYYMGVCSSLGMNPMTRPFEFIRLNGREVLYAKRDAADQLRKINQISIEVVSQKTENDLFIVHVKAQDISGRFDEDFGAVSVLGLKGESLANAMLKAITKAKRRVTLSISGLGFLDETEVADIPTAEPLKTEPKPDIQKLTDEAKAFAGEVELADTPEKLFALENRYIALKESLTENNLGKWADKLAALLTTKRTSLATEAA